MLSSQLRERLRGLLERARGETVDRERRELTPLLRGVELLGPEMEGASDVELRERGAALRNLAAENMLPDPVVAEGVALVCEAARRVLQLRLHQAQILAALALYRGTIAELATGEGKTLAAVAPAWLLSLFGRGVHVLTFNDYLARRDASWMGPVYAFLGASVGCIQDGMDPDARGQAYACDVTYATAKQAGFDYLRDQLALATVRRVHRPFHAAIVDEADSLLIDEARVPLVLASGSLELPVDPHGIARIVERLAPSVDYETDKNARNVFLTERGALTVERELDLENLHDSVHRDVLTAVNLALHARALLRRDVDYVVREGRIEVVDEFTGRVVPDRRWPDGLHPALEAKEGLAVRPEGTILSSLPLQHFFRLYPKLSGMTATAVPAAEELSTFYGLSVTVIPSHRPCIRVDEPDAVFTDRQSKEAAVVADVRDQHAAGRPILVGTASVAESERIAAAIAEAGIVCRVLNAKNDEEEARIIAEAGGKGAVTISTNMAGRGTDIRLGGLSERDRAEVVALQGLRVIGTNKHETRRVDDQLRGRAGRQGDPGSSRFFVSFEDDLVQRYAFTGDIAQLLTDRPAGRIDSSMVAAEIDRAQRIVEGQNFDIRRTLWSYSALVEQQRLIMGELREQELQGTSSVDLPRRSPEHHARILDRQGPAATAGICRLIALVEIQRAWSAHLASLADIRENIHFHYLAGLDWFGGIWGLRKRPLDVFHEMAVHAFDEMRAALDASIVRAFEAVDPSTGRVAVEPHFLNPESTWTYLISDTPFESTIIRLYRGMSRAVTG